MTDNDKALVAELRINDKEIYLPVLGKSADRIEALNAENERLREALREIQDLDGEINLSNYDYEDAWYLNQQFCSAGTIADKALGETK